MAGWETVNDLGFTGECIDSLKLLYDRLYCLGTDQRTEQLMADWLTDSLTQLSEDWLTDWVI